MSERGFSITCEPVIDEVLEFEILRDLNFRPPCFRYVCSSDATFAGHYIGCEVHGGTFLYCEPCAKYKKNDFDEVVAKHGYACCPQCKPNMVFWTDVWFEKL